MSTAPPRSPWKHRAVAVLLILGLTGLLLFAVNRPQIGRASQAPTVSLGATVISEGDDYATRVLGMPWDMRSGPYPGFPTVFDNIDRPSYSTTGGLWNMTATNSDPNIWMLWPSIVDTQQVLRLGDGFPIDASRYRLFSMRLCSSTADYANLYWYHAPLTPPGNADGVSDFIQTSSGCRVYTADLANIDTFSGSWTGQVMGLRIDPVTTVSGANFQLDWVRVTSADTSNVLPIHWNGVSPGSALYFYLTPTSCGAEGTLIGTQTAGSSSGTFSWGSALIPDPTAPKSWQVLPLPESFEPGNYRVYLRENGAGPAICASGTLEIHEAPRLTFQKPSMFSGSDYASENLGDPWGMAQNKDVYSTYDLANVQFDQGLLTGITTGLGDPRVRLTVGPPIDTNRYRYATFRMWIDAEYNFSDGWVQRFIWWYQGPGIDSVTTEDMIVYEGWHTYSFDLKTAVYEPGGSWSGNPTAFRLDPHEIPALTGLEVDFVLLTSDERIPAGAVFPIIYETTPGSGVTVTFYYDTDRNPGNGRTPITIAASAAPAAAGASGKLYLPIIRKGSGEVELITGQAAPWDTAGVPKGTYYISADVSDGVMTTTWYSEVPVIID